MSDVPPRQRFGDWVVQRRLGRGGMGTVYLGHSDARGDAAIKVLDATSDDGTFRARFVQEVDAARGVRSPYVSAVLDAEPMAAHPWVAMEYVDGPSLHESVGAHGPLDPDRVLTIVGEIAQALVDIHAAGIVHRDLKPSNVLLGSDARARVVDFGIAIPMANQRVSRTETRVGTLGYMAPEQVRGDGVDRASDVFALGGLTYFLATGRTAFQGEDSDAVMAAVVALRYDAHLLDDARIAALVDACLRADAADRETPAQIVQRCRRALAGQVDPPAPPARIVRPRARQRRNAALAAAALAAAALAAPLLGGFAWWATRENSQESGSQNAATASTRATATTPLELHVAAVAAEAATYPAGNQVRLRWDEPDTRPGANTLLMVNGRPPPPGCPARLTSAGRCTFVGSHDTTYAVTVQVTAPGRDAVVGSASTAQTFVQPEIRVQPGAVFTDPAGSRACRVLVTARGLKPATQHQATLTADGNAPMSVLLSKTDERGNFADSPLSSDAQGQPTSWGYGYRNGSVTVTLDALTATKAPWGCP